MPKLLDTIRSPKDIAGYTVNQLRDLSQEVRDDIIDTVSRLGGHFASSLGAAELVVALHHVFEAPTDKLVWDMGYQAYAHKLLTGRRDAFRATLKQRHGMSGFVNKDESEYDLFTSGHGGTTISTAMGLAMARDRHGQQHKVVTILGDSSLGEGMALEGLNHAGHLKDLDLLVVLNDNTWSIAPSVGGMRRYLNNVITAPVYNRFRDDFEALLNKLPKGKTLLNAAKQVEEGVKGMLVPGRLFEDLGFRYFGPIDGHDMKALVNTLRNVKRLHGPILVHVVTTKGKGYAPAEDDPENFHKTGPFHIDTGKPKTVVPKQQSGARDFRGYTDAFTKTLIREAAVDERVVAISAAMQQGTGLHPFASQFPDRCYDVGMAEQHGVGFCAGMATGGLKPVVAMYSTFLQRAYDQIFHDVCLQRLPVIFAIDRAGIVGEDGPTHHGIFDIAYMRTLPEMTMMAPRHEQELAAMLQFALDCTGPIGIRYPRGKSLTLSQTLRKTEQAMVLGESEMLVQGEDVAIFALGSMVHPAVEAARQLEQEGIHATVVNARFIKPMDRAMLRALAERHRTIITIEEAALEGGFGSAVLEAVEEERLHSLEVFRIGIPTAFIEHATIQEIMTELRLTPDGLAEHIREMIQQRVDVPALSVIEHG